MDLDKTQIAGPKILGEGEKSHYLSIVRGPNRGKRYELVDQSTVIGRGDVEIQILDSSVSKSHCRIIIFGGDAVVEDLGSTNGTLLDGERLTEPRPLPPGAALQLGNTLLSYQLLSRREVREAARLEEDLDDAADYVRSLLPPPLESEAVSIQYRYIPSEKLAGDSFGYHFLPDGRLAIYLLDVSGHGAAAALHTVSMLNLLRKRTLPGVDFGAPDQVLRAVNNSFQMREHAGKYLTVWYGVWSPDDRRLVYASAGHPPALLAKSGNGEDEQLITPNLAVGFMPGVEFKTAETVVPPGSRLFVYSDGAYEVIIGNGEEWERAEFLALLGEPPAPDGDETGRVERGVRAVMAANSFPDDFSLVVATFK